MAGGTGRKDAPEKDLGQCFSHAQQSPRDHARMQILNLTSGEGSQSVFLTTPQVMLMLLVHRPYSVARVQETEEAGFSN